MLGASKKIIKTKHIQNEISPFLYLWDTRHDLEEANLNKEKIILEPNNSLINRYLYIKGYVGHMREVMLDRKEVVMEDFNQGCQLI